MDLSFADNSKRSLSCFIVESILGCGGQIVLPENYLKETFKIIKNKKSLCIIDEVQTGFARVGNNFWAFEEHNVIPDIVTLGKPMGNGHPIGAVITTNEIANSFNNGMEYFNSFGGNPVSCSVGNAVLNIIEDEGLQKHALLIGKYLLKSLKNLNNYYPEYISEVRGRGMFLGIDIIDPKTSLPSKKIASKIINLMRENAILLSTDGPYQNVIKIKPPMPFNKNDCDLLFEKLNLIISKL